ncbi:MAG TPA: DNA polymerase I, partial [bacterium]|nr:DNA polymerase I [bacterium]
MKQVQSPPALGKVLLIDGNAFCYRAYYAIPSLSNSAGEPTNALYGFITMIRKLLAETSPEYAAVCFDRKEPTFRHDRFKEYKAHRKPMPEDLISQIEPIKEYCRLSGFALFEKAGYEADDILGTLAVSAEKEGHDVLIATGDKDAMQLVTDRIKIIFAHKENLIFDTAAVRRRFDGLGPGKVVDLMALMGDSSDNIPGVRGIGEKTAIKLIQEFGSLERLLEHVGRVKSKSQQALLREHAEMAKESKYLAAIDTRVPVEVNWDQIRVRQPNEASLAEFFKRYEFRTLLKELSVGSSMEEGKREYRTVLREKEFEKLLQELKNAPVFSFDTETTSPDPTRAKLVGLSFSWAPFKAVYVAVSGFFSGGESELSLEKIIAGLRPLLEDPDKKKVGQNIKYDWIVMKEHGVTLRGIVFDTMIASYLVNPLKLNHNLDDISFEYLGVKKITTASLLGSGKKQITMAEVSLEKIAEYAAEDADCVFRLVPILKKKLEEYGLEELFKKMELPLLEVLAKMEMNGVRLDLKFLKELSDNAGKDLERLSSGIIEEAGFEFNINSTKQLAEVLFEKMKLPVIKRTKTGYSTDVSVLEKLAQTYEFPKKLLEYREKTKLKSTYLDALPEMVNSRTELVHTSYNQTTTATGRLSSSDPNLQNIPVRTETGRLVRKAFIPRGPKRKILGADYSQIELRILAHLSGDKNLTQAFHEDRDIHRFTATLLYGVKEADVTRPMRDLAKLVNFSVIYGKTAFGLSQELKISVSEADSFIQSYFKRYAQVNEYIEFLKEQARKNGFLTTIFGRRSFFPDINSRNVQIRQFAERAAVNAPIQGSAADLIKVAMITIQQRIEAEKLNGLMIMQVHDELVFDVAEEETEK